MFRFFKLHCHRDGKKRVEVSRRETDRERPGICWQYFSKLYARKIYKNNSIIPRNSKPYLLCHSISLCRRIEIKEAGPRSKLTLTFHFVVSFCLVLSFFCSKVSLLLDKSINFFFLAPVSFYTGLPQGSYTYFVLTLHRARINRKALSLSSARLRLHLSCILVKSASYRNHDAITMRSIAGTPQDFKSC